MPCHSCYICGTWRSKEVGGFKSSNGGKGKSHKEGESLWGGGIKTTQGVDPSTSLYELPTYFSLFCFGVKRYMHYTTFPSL